MRNESRIHVRRILTLGVALVFAVAAVPLAAQQKNDKNQPKRSKTEQQDIETLVRLVDAVSAGTQPAPTDVAIAWESGHFMKGQDGITFLPFTVTVDRAKLNSPAVALYIRVVQKGVATLPPPPPADSKDSKDKKAPAPVAPQYPWNSVSFWDIPANGKVSRAIGLKPGEYEAFITIKDKATEQKNAPAAKVGMLRHDISVPDFDTDELKTSSVIVASAVDLLQQPLTPAQQEENPYVFGPMKVTPSVDGKFGKSGELNLIFWIYGAAQAATGKPDVQIEYAFHQKLAEGEKYFNRTQPQALNAQSLPPEFSVAAGHQLPGSLTIPLASFPAGDYRLEIKVSDKTSGKSVVQNVTFTVLPV